MSSAALPIARIAAQVVASFGVSKILRDVIANNVTIVTTADSVKVAAGTLVLGSMIAESASNHVDARVKTVADWLESRKTDTTDS